MNKIDDSGYGIKIDYSFSSEKIEKIKQKKYDYIILQYYKDRYFVEIYCDNFNKAKVCTDFIQNLINQSIASAADEKELKNRIRDGNLSKAIWKAIQENDEKEKTMYFKKLVDIFLVLETIDAYNSLWNEYKYRHELIWKFLFQSIGAAIVVSVATYTQSSIVNKLDPWFYPVFLLIPFWILLYSALSMERELKLFEKIKVKYRSYQTRYFNIEHNVRKLFFDFNRRVKYVYRILILLSLIHIPLGLCINPPGILQGMCKIISSKKDPPSKEITAIVEKYKQEKQNLDQDFIEINKEIKNIPATSFGLDISRLRFINGTNVRLREAPSKKSQIRAELNNGQILEVVGKQENWIEVKGTFDGWVSIRYTAKFKK